MQFLLVRGQNDDADGLAVKAADFAAFVDRHSSMQALVPEANDAMVGSYIMVDPSGCLYGNHGAVHLRGAPVCEAGLVGQLERLGYSYQGTERRNGFYF